jgi:carbon storage regulator
MLVLTRKAGESILIGDDIRITVIKGKNGRLAIGIKADKDVRIVREELLSNIVSMALEASPKAA